MSAAKSAVIVGGGIVGLVSARALAQQGLRVTLLERKPRIEDEGGIGIGIQNNAMNALAEIGVADRIVAAGVTVDTIAVFAPNGQLLVERPTERYCGSSQPGYTGISRAALHNVLVSAVREAGVELLTDAAVERVEQSENEAAAILADGRRVAADILVACDGIYSQVREQLFPDHARPQPTGEAVWRALLPGVKRDDVSFVFGAGVGTVGYCPMKDDLYIYAVDRADRAPPRDADNLAEMFSDILCSIPGFPSEYAPLVSHVPGDVMYRPLETIQIPPPWHKGRIILIGDAAHAGPPTLAQGAAMGMEDGVVLAQVVAAHDDVPAAFTAFMERRWPRVRTIVDASLRISRAQMRPDGKAEMAEANAAAAAMLATPY